MAVSSGLEETQLMPTDDAPTQGKTSASAACIQD